MNSLRPSIVPKTLCLVTTQSPNTSCDQFLEFVAATLEGGVTMVQFREKHRPYEEQLAIARALHALTLWHQVPLIINDHVQLALDCQAEGVHLGQDDLHPDQARTLLGPSKIIGWSIETRAQLERANALTSIDYVGASAVFPTQHKNNCKTHWGLEGLNHLCTHSVHPVIAIGGIHLENITAVMHQGPHGVAVIGALHQAAQPREAAQHLSQKIHQHHNIQHESAHDPFK
jgi:thiamine-phosphate pyrophosphorylase